MGRWQGLSTAYWAGPHWAWPHRPFVPLFGTKTRAVLLIPWSPSPLPSRCVLLVLGVCHFKRFYIRHVPRRRAASSSSTWSSATLRVLLRPGLHQALPALLWEGRRHQGGPCWLPACSPPAFTDHQKGSRAHLSPLTPKQGSALVLSPTP